MHYLSIDIETRSSEPIGKTGLYKYAQSPDFTVLLCGYSIDGGPVQQIDFTGSRGEWEPEFTAFKQLLTEPDYVKRAYNAAFEWYCLYRLTGLTLPPNQWQDTMLHSLYCGYPASLDAAGKAMGLPEDKRKLATGKALIKLFCTPHKQTDKDHRPWINPHDEPEKWQLFRDYNKQDVITEYTIGQRLKQFPVPDDVQQQWIENLLLNTRGIALDMDLITGAIEANKKAVQPLIEEAQRITGLGNPNSTAQIKGWMQRRGYTVDTLRKENVDDLLDSGKLDPDAHRILEIRKETGKTSVKKYEAMRQTVCTDGRARGVLQFYGANRTGRWSGKIIQPQNLPRTYIQGKALDCARELAKRADADGIQMLFGTVPDTLSQLIRTALIPTPGNKFIDADFSAIEARVIAWLANETWSLQVFRTTGKIYEATAAQMFHVPEDSIAKGKPNYPLRQRGKVATLALGYEGGIGALIRMNALRMGIPEDDLPKIRDAWRKANPHIVHLWKEIENAAFRAAAYKKSTLVQGKLLFTIEDKNNYFMTIQLPSGRKLFYNCPHLKRDENGNPKLYYWGQNQTTKKWQEIGTYAGKLTENCTQAIARDCLAVNIHRLMERDYNVVFHIHDEVVIDATPDQHLQDVIDIMRTPISWAPGLPLNADGWEGNYFTKN
jgi:DNA polymerase